MPTERVDELKEVIHQRLLTQVNLPDVIDLFIKENSNQGEGLTESDILSDFRQKAVIDDIVKTLMEKNKDQGLETAPSLDHQKQTKGVSDHIKTGLDPAKQYIHLKILSGRAFLDHLDDSKNIDIYKNDVFIIHAHFQGQRHVSKPVLSSCEPRFDATFLFEVHHGTSCSIRDRPSEKILSLADKIHLVLVKESPSGEHTLLSSCHLQWRDVLSANSGTFRKSVEINGIGAETNVPVGILDICVSFMPKPTQTVAPNIITAQVKQERSRSAEREHLFLAYAKQWWREFLQMRSSHSNRLVKIFAQDENGVHRFACSYVYSLQAGRLIDSPRHAARFVSLIEYERQPSASGIYSDGWNSMLAFLAKRKGGVEDHSVLLCSLLIGFGLNAYVCMGTKDKGIAHTWVVTIASDGSVKFWESLSALQYEHINITDETHITAQKTPAYPYRTVGCLFNRRSFYANIQPTDDIRLCSFNLYSDANWKKMSIDAINSIVDSNTKPSLFPVLHLLPALSDPNSESIHMEKDLRQLVVNHRLDMSLDTAWNNELSYLLSSALAFYEFEYTMGVSAGNDDFQHAIRMHVPEGYTFKGFPAQFIHTNARRALAVCLKSSICQDIVSCRGDEVKLALRVKIHSYPEDMKAVWVMFAVTYRSVT